MSGIVDEIFEKYYDASATERQYLRWRIGPDAFDAILAASFPEIPHDANDDHPIIKQSRAQQRAQRLEGLEFARASWGKEDSLLMGLNTICDDDFEGVRLEETYGRTG